MPRWRKEARRAPPAEAPTPANSIEASLLTRCPLDGVSLHHEPPSGSSPRSVFEKRRTSLLTSGSPLPRPSRVNGGFFGFASRLQWRDRAGLEPASWTPSLSSRDRQYTDRDITEQPHQYGASPLTTPIRSSTKSAVGEGAGVWTLGLCPQCSVARSCERSWSGLVQRITEAETSEHLRAVPYERARTDAANVYESLAVCAFGPSRPRPPRRGSQSAVPW